MLELHERMMREINHKDTAWSAGTIRLMNYLPTAARAALAQDYGSVSIRDLQTANVERCQNNWHPVRDWNPLEWGGAMAGEAGEAANKAKKLRRISQWEAKLDIEHSEAVKLREEILEEISDTFHYGVLLAACVGGNLERATITKFNVVSARRDVLERMGDNGELV